MILDFIQETLVSIAEQVILMVFYAAPIIIILGISWAIYIAYRCWQKGGWPF